MNIGIFGLGYVGVVNIACFSSLGHKVTGCDIKSQKVAAILDGKSPIYEPEVDELLQQGLDKGLISATTDAAVVIMDADILLVCVGTPSAPDGTVNLDFTINTTLEIARALSNTSKNLTVAFRSTIPPGSVEGTFRKVLDEHLVNYSGVLKLAFYPEFLREGSAVQDFLHAPRIVIGTVEEDISLLKSLLSYNDNSPIIIADTETAEFVKYVDNCFHATKVTFANEVYAIGNALGINVAKANEIFLTDRQLNISPAYLRPGLPFGGSCLPKDLRAMNHFARQTNIDVPLLRSLAESNHSLLQRIEQKILGLGKKKILLVGLTFKNHTDDVRESPMMALAQLLIQGGISLSIYDEDIREGVLRTDFPSIIKHLKTDLPAAIAAAEVVAVCKRYMPEVLPHLALGQEIINLGDLKDYSAKVPVLSLYK